MTYERYKMKDKYYKIYFYVIDKKTEVSTMIPTLEIMVEFFKEKYNLEFTVEELKKAKNKSLNIKDKKYSEFVTNFAVGIRNTMEEEK